MAKLSQIFPDKEVKVTMDSGVQINLFVNTNKVTFEAFDAMQEKLKKGAEGDGNSTREVLTMFCAYVTSWDVEKEDGEMLELDPDVLYKTLGPVAVLPILKSFTEAINPTAGE